MFSTHTLPDLHTRNDFTHNVCGMHAIVEYFGHVWALAGIKTFVAITDLYGDLLYRLDSSIQHFAEECTSRLDLDNYKLFQGSV